MQHYFPKSEGYVHHFQDYIAGGFVDRYTYQWVPQPIGPDPQYPFLVSQCKGTLLHIVGWKTRILARTDQVRNKHSWTHYSPAFDVYPKPPHLKNGQD